MAKMILYIATSLDGMIALRNGSVDWLYAFEKRPDGQPEDHGYHAFLESIGTVVMGSKTYESVLTMTGPYPYENKRSVVFSSRKLPAPPNGEIISEPAESYLRQLKREAKEDIWLIGGGQLIHTCAQAGLIDEMRLFYVPVMIGEGRPLNAGPEFLTQWTFTGSTPYETGIVELKYVRK